jgi:hypothetical protein
MHILSNSELLETQFIFLIRIVEVWIQTGSIRHVGHFWPIIPAPDDCEDGEFGGLKIGRGPEVLGENLPQRHFVYHKSNLTRPGLEPGPPRWETSD